MDNVDKLLFKLDDATNATKKALNESFDFSSIASRLDKVCKYIISSGAMTELTLDERKRTLIDRANAIYIPDSFRLLTYPNIHNEKKYNIDSSILFEYVLKEISENAKNGGNNFDKDIVSEKAIAYTYKYITGKTFLTRMTMADFKKEYRKYVFGSDRKVPVRPDVRKLSKLARNSPYIISFITHKMIRRQIDEMTEYSKKVKKDFIKLINNDPSLEPLLQSYLSCIVDSMRNLVDIYKTMRQTFVDLDKEYYFIFDRLIAACSMNESIASNDVAIKNLCEEDIYSNLYILSKLNADSKIKIAIPKLLNEWKHIKCNTDDLKTLDDLSIDMIEVTISLDSLSDLIVAYMKDIKTINETSSEDVKHMGHIKNNMNSCIYAILMKLKKYVQ